MLPTFYCHLHTVESDTFIADCDVGEMFLNFMLDSVIRPHAGVDLSVFEELKQRERKSRGIVGNNVHGGFSLLLYSNYTHVCDREESKER